MAANGIVNISGIWLHNDIFPNTKLYHFFRHDFFDELIKTRKIYLENLLGWADPWEIPAKLIAVNPEEDDDTIFFIKGQYESFLMKENGICFTKDYDNDAMWRQYADKKENPSKAEEYLCIETTVADILNAIDISQVLNAFIAPVIYLDIDKYSGDQLFNNNYMKDYPDSCYMAFVKRKAFDHENEIRLVASLKGENGGAKKINIDIRFIKKIIVNSTWGKEKVEKIRREYEGLNIPVEQSQLFKTSRIKLKNAKKIAERLCENPNIMPNNAKLFKEYEL